jgi:hydroxyacylglutathione hydrolase
MQRRSSSSFREMGVQVKMILVTHGHFDHFLAAGEIRKHTGAPVALHAADNQLWAALPIQCMMLGMPAPTAAIAPPEVALTDGMALPVRNGRVIHTPGHSPGSSCFYFPDDALCCTGDTLFQGSVGRTDLMGGDSAALVRSIQQKLYTLPVETQCIPGHGPTTSIGQEAKFNGVVRAGKSAL